MEQINQSETELLGRILYYTIILYDYSMNLYVVFFKIFAPLL